MRRFTTNAVGIALGLAVLWPPAPLLAQAPASIEIEPSSLTLEVGQKAQLTAVVKDSDGNILPNAQVLFFSRARRKLGVTPSGSIEPYLPGDFETRPGGRSLY